MGTKKKSTTEEVVENVNVNEEVKETKKEVEKVKKQITTNVSKDKIIMGSIVGSVIVIALIIFGVFLYNSNFKSLAKFDGGSLNITDFNIYYKTFQPMLASWGYTDDMARDEIINKASIDQIVLMLAKEKGITATEENLQEVKKLMEDKTQFEHLKQLGIDPAQMENLYVNDFIIAAYVEYLKTNLTSDEVKKYITEKHGAEANMNEYITKHVLISTIDTETGEELSKEDQDKAKKEAEEIITKLNNGSKIEDLAKEFSDDTYSAKEGGLIKTYLDDSLVKEYTDAVTKLEVGKYTTVPVKSDYGYHIIYLEKHDPQGRINSDAEREAIVSKKLDELAKEYNLKIDLDGVNKAIFDLTGVDLNKDDVVDVYSK